MKCNKCGNEIFYVEKHGNNIGLYCKSCGKWQKWLNKDETRIFKHEENTENEIKKEYLLEFIDFLDKEIDKQIERNPLSLEDNISKCTYATAYEKTKIALENILNGRRYCDYE